ncbi:hypothetical protein [Ammoniphilus sp. CFH 90114]|uniref:hypothetical protein n=1 Tax=Ammoniphilus sp. CFH 90114 TaxID=2493665 RepID=UPI00100EFBB9|nr:hypothetical protein [Ammoniphilus sp. CFH 90114]RXT05753.1 hypothetical protein EIZ39_16740 [Ammoniphilus sp. CFH 90114]
MPRKLFSIMFTLLCLFTTACATQNAEEAEADKTLAQEVVRQFEQSQSSITYSDPATFTQGDQFLTPEFAAQYHEMRAGMEQFILDSKSTVTGTEPTITFVKREGNDLFYTLESTRTIASEETNASAESHIKYLVTVTKKNSESYLISNMEETS